MVDGSKAGPGPSTVVLVQGDDERPVYELRTYQLKLGYTTVAWISWMGWWQVVTGGEVKNHWGPICQLQRDSPEFRLDFTAMPHHILDFDSWTSPQCRCLNLCRACVATNRFPVSLRSTPWAWKRSWQPTRLANPNLSLGDLSPCRHPLCFPWILSTQRLHYTRIATAELELYNNL